MAPVKVFHCEISAPLLLCVKVFAFLCRDLIVKALTLFVLSSPTVWAQIGLGGFNAVLTVPTARVLPDGALATGFGFIPRPYALYGNPGHDNLAYFASVGFLPFLEVGLRATHALNDSLTDLGDRMASLRVRVLSETHMRPALVLGLHDLVAIQGRQGWFNSLYAVLTKNISISNHLILETTAGYGIKWKKARSHEFADLFGGWSLRYRELFFLKAEFDTHKLNYGLVLQMGKSLTALLAFLEGRSAAYGASLQISL